MKHYFYIFYFFLTINAFAQISNNFSFENSLRIDFQIYGDATTENIVFSQLKKEPFWGGSKVNLKFPDFGELRLQLIDNKSNSVLFSKGFNSLFCEWQHTELAKNQVRLFEHSVQVPFPKKTMKAVIEKRQKDGNFQKIAEKIISPDDYFIKNESVQKFPVRTLLKNGNPSTKVDLVILAEGYTSDQTQKFYADAQRMINYMFSLPPFDKLKKDFNVYAVAVTSLESGTDIPGSHIFRNTAFNSSFYTFNTERYLTSNDMFAICDAASLVPYDHIYVLVNTSTYGGGGFYNHLNLATSDHPFSKEVFAHEFGHGFAGLADEYYTSETAFGTMYQNGVEPWEPNITTMVNFEKKWKEMVKKTTPIPTPRTADFDDVVGVFEGGGYSAKGVFSPMQDCRMKTNTANGFCPVCSKTIENVVKFYTK